MPSQRRKDRHKKLSDAMNTLLHELKDDLAKNHKEGASAELERALDGKTGAALMDDLLNEESALCKAIPLQLLEKTPKGREYLDVLTELRRAARPASPSDPLANLPELLPGGDSGQLGDLVREVMSSGDFCRMNMNGGLPSRPI